jgi:RNA polymerase sigma-70 factor (ECF subfamily)
MVTAFEAIYREFHEKIRHYLVQLVGQAEAEDVTQEVFVKVNQGLETFKGASKLSTWIYQIATNAGLDRLRSAWHRQSTREVSVSGEAGEPEMELEDRDPCTAGKRLTVPQQVIKFEMNACIREFVNRLPPDYRAVIVLSELKELKNQEIADILGISLDTVKIRLHRARVRLKKEFTAGCDLYRDEHSDLSCDRKVPESS